jgi:hypothetical protein
VLVERLVLKVIKDDKVHRQSGQQEIKDQEEIKVHHQLVMLVLKVIKEDKVHHQ